MTDISVRRQADAVLLEAQGLRAVRARRPKNWPQADNDRTDMRIAELEAASKTLRAIEPHLDEIRALIVSRRTTHAAG